MGLSIFLETRQKKNLMGGWCICIPEDDGYDEEEGDDDPTAQVGQQQRHQVAFKLVLHNQQLTEA